MEDMTANSQVSQRVAEPKNYNLSAPAWQPTSYGAAPSSAPREQVPPPAIFPAGF